MPTSENLRKTSVQLWVNVGSLPKTSEIFFLFSRCKVKVTLQALSRFGGKEVDLMWRRSHLLFLGGGGQVVRYQGVIKGKSPDFRSPEIGISALGLSETRLCCNFNLRRKILRVWYRFTRSCDKCHEAACLVKVIGLIQKSEFMSNSKQKFGFIMIKVELPP